MRTRSEWFLGPKDGDLLCVPTNACSNCCLTVKGNYLGGGSSRDMRRMLDQQSALQQQSQQQQQQQQQHHVNEAVNTSLYLYYKQRHHQQQQPNFQQLPLQRQSFHMSPEHMDTDESFSSYATGGSNSINQQLNLHSMQQQLSAIHQQQQQQPPAHFNTRQAQEGQGLFLDTNYGRYDFDDKDILITTTTDNNNYNYNNNNNNNNYFKENKSNIDGYTLSNRQHLIKTTTSTTTTTNDMILHPNITTHTLLTPLSTSSGTSSLSLYHLHTNNNQKNSKISRRQHNISQYYSTESLLNKHDIDDVDGGEAELEDQDEPCTSNSIMMTSKLTYQSPRLLQNQEREREERELKSYHTLINHNTTLNSTKSNTLTSTANTTNSTKALEAKDEVDEALLNKTEEDVDYIVTSHYRHSTPMLQRRRLRQQQALRRQRLPSTSSSLYQSFNASLQAPMTSANLGPVNRFNVVNSTAAHNSTLSSISNYESQSTLSSSAGGGSSRGNSNFVSIIFNVLDFLF